MTVFLTKIVFISVLLTCEKFKIKLVLHGIRKKILRASNKLAKNSRFVKFK